MDVFLTYMQALRRHTRDQATLWQVKDRYVTLKPARVRECSLCLLHQVARRGKVSKDKTEYMVLDAISRV